MKEPFTPPYVGAAYYPELWPESEQSKDIARMRELGCNVMRVGEFAWAYMEPEEGRYEFSWLHGVIDRLTDAGIATVLCTPTAAPPVWLTEKHPETVAAAAEGQPYVHGSRRHNCPNSPVYREYSRAITTRLAGEFAEKKGVIVWHLDNEFGCHINSCYCGVCRDAFHRFLEGLYGNIEALNERWGTGVWSQRYQRFEQIPLPQKTPYTHHPSLVHRYRHFMSHSFAEFAREQAGIIRAKSPLPVTTNGMPPWHKLDYEEMFADLDIVSNDLYNGPEHLWTLAGEFDWMRAKKPRPYWLMETSATWGGSLTPGAVYVHHPGAMRAKCWLSFAMGGEAVLYWLWRAQWSGQEMEHGSLLYSWGEPALARLELKDLVTDLKACADFLNDTKPAPAQVAVHFSYPSMWVFDEGPLAAGFNYMNGWNEFYRQILDRNIHRDVIFPGADVASYNVVFSPFMAIIPGEVIERMKAFVEAGGTWVIGPMSGFRTEDATARRESGFGPLEDVIGSSVRHRFPPPPMGANLDWGKSGRSACRLWCDAYRSTAETKVLARYADGPAAGAPAVLERALGKGRVITLGTLPDHAELSRIIEEACWETTGLPAEMDPPAGIIVIPRVHMDGTPAGHIFIDIAGKGGEVVGVTGVDKLTAESVGGTLKLKPWGVAVVV